MQTLLAPPRAAFTTAQVLAALSLSNRAPRIRHGVDVLNSAGNVTNELLHVESGSVTWSYRPADRVTGQTTDAAAVRRTAELDVVGVPSFPLYARRYRIWTEWLGPDGVWVRFYLGVFLSTLPPTSDDGLVLRSKLTLADKTWTWANTPLSDPLTIPAGSNPVTWVTADLASTFGETAVAFTSTTVTLTNDMTYEAGMSRLAVYASQMQVAAFDDVTCDESGIPGSAPLSTLTSKGSEYTYGPGAGKIVTAGDIEPLQTTLPNVVRFVARSGPSLATEGNGIVTVTNQSTGPASVSQLGRSVLLTVEVDCENQTQLAAVAAADAQRYFAGGGLRFTGKVGLNPLHSNRDVVTLNKPRLGLSGLWQVTSWTYPLHAFNGEDDVLMAVELEQKVA